MTFAFDMWMESEPDWPLAVWKVPIENLLILPVTLVAKLGDVSGIWFQLHGLSALLWGVAVSAVVTWRVNRAEQVGGLRP